MAGYWKSRDGLKIPKHGTEERAAWNDGFHGVVARVFAGGDASRLKPVKIPITPNMGSNMPVNKDRLRLYSRMVADGDPLPPVVVRRNGQSYDLVDGNHRLAAAQAHGRTHLEALEITDVDKKNTKSS